MPSLEQLFFQNSSLLNPPKVDEVEIVIFGKGYGECIVIHVGNSRFIIIDSFTDLGSDKSIAEVYLEKIGMNPENIVLVVCTHWHMDHIQGLASLFKKAVNAKFSTSALIAKEKFQTFLGYGQTIEKSSTKEFVDILNEVKRRDNNSFRMAGSNKIIYSNFNESDETILNSTLYSLSPQDNEVLEYIENLNLPNINSSTYIFPNDNDISVATWLEFHDVAVLLSADLENKHNKNHGWNAVLSNHTFTSRKASIFKVPHHGSINGHNGVICQQLLSDNVVSILTTYSKSRLPFETDKKRIDSFSNKTFIVGSQKSRDNELKKLKRDFIKDDDDKLFQVVSSVGVVRLRKNVSDDWLIEKYGTVEEYIEKKRT